MQTTTSRILATITLFAAMGCGGEASSSGPKAPAHGEPANEQPKKKHDAMIRKIDTFLADPSQGDPGEIVRFVNASPDVLVVYRPGFVHFDDASTDVNALLLAAFAAGNARAQLQNGTKKDSPLEGVRGELAVYNWLKTKKADLRIAQLEELASRASGGDLEARVQELAK